MVTHVEATSAFMPVLSKMHTEFLAASRSAMGSNMMRQWSYEDEEVAEVVENLQAQARSYKNEGSCSEDDMDSD
ncbi:hypothetical protein CYMTET_28572 [Cymbomonas tetramitiformis]|uniref:Uncharacterized protein n=1 Tax=Cymbomonas tetramitiformis TaxID=36881 RepID=A0AAE0FMJ4_9CHLO|nr:hypothetical protein CYMTET_28572 [Cymbomonas tetramitiformis]